MADREAVHGLDRELTAGVFETALARRTGEQRKIHAENLRRLGGA